MSTIKLAPMRYWVAILGVFALGVLIGWGAHKQQFEPERHKRFVELRSNPTTLARFSFTNPLLECQGAEDYFNDLTPFKDELVAHVEKLKADGYADEVSVYFRDLNNGPWIGIKERDNYQPASLLKVPMMIGVLKLAEGDPGLLRRKIVYDGPMDLHQNMPQGVGLQSGQKYTMLEVLRSLMEHSDNRSVWLIDKLYDQKKLRDPVFAELGIPSIESSPNLEISMKNYASFFRILYNASYLNREMSELALELLSEAEMKDALVAGVPPTVPVAHKFGRMNRDSTHAQLHDCGIVYYPGHPYMLCVMTRGTDQKKLASAISSISGFVYQTVTSQLILEGANMRAAGGGK